MFRKNLLKFYCLLLLAGIGTSALAVNESEPNDAWNQANAITLGATGNGTCTATGDVDWWRVTSATDGKLTINWTATNSLYVFCQIYDTLGGVLLASNYSNGSSILNADGLAAGTYYIKFFAYYASQAVTYSFIPSWIIPAQVTDAEPNGTYSQAVPININDTAGGHIGYYYNNHRDTLDWYKVTTTEDGKLSYTITSLNGQYVYLQLLDANGNTHLGGGYTASTATFNTDGLAAGTYYFRLINFYNTEWAPYKFVVKLVSLAQTTDIGPNSTKNTAQTIQLNDSITGHVGYYNNGARDTNDWFKLTTNNDGQLNFKLYSLSNCVYLEVYNNKAKSLLYSAYTCGGTLSYSRNDLAKGTYFVKVYCYYSSGFTPYALVNNLINNNPTDVRSNAYADSGKVINGFTTQTGNINYYFNGIRDTNDWWKIAFYNGSLNLTINKVQHTFDSNYPDIVYQLYKDTTAAPVDNQTLTGGVSFNFNYTTLTTGTYYIRISQSNNTFGGYSITADYKDTTSQTATIVSYNADTICSNGKINYYITRGFAPYTVQLYRNGIATGAPVITPDTAKFSGLITGVYSVTVKGNNAIAYTVASRIRSIVPKPANTNNLTVSSTSAIVTWTKLLCVDGYKFGWKLSGAATYNDTILPGTATRDTINNLNPNTHYQWHVSAFINYNGQAYGIYTEIKRFKTLVARFGDVISDDESAVETISVYPNPVSDKINFVIDDASPLISITITNVLGQDVKTSNGNNEIYHSVDVSALKQGVYFITIKTSTNLYTSRFVKE